MKATSRQSASLLTPIFGSLALLGLASCGVKEEKSDKSGATDALTSILPKPQTPTNAITSRREKTVQFVWVSEGENGPKGGASPLTIRVDPNPTGEPAVGVVEEYSRGAGEQWRTAAWIAAFNATTATGVPISNAEFTVKTGGNVDGPSAGLLTTATMMALLNNVAVREDTTITGTINPDGSAGVVGGIPQKLMGAKEKGFKRFGFPIGCRQARDLESGDMVDLLELAKKQDIEIRELHDLWEAYEFLTGKSIARPKPLSSTEMDLGTAETRHLKEKIDERRAAVKRDFPLMEKRVKAASQLMRQAGKELAGLVESLLDDCAAAWNQGQNFERNGYTSAAYMKYIEASAHLRGVSMALEILPSFVRFNLEEIDKIMGAYGQVGERVEELGKEMTDEADHKTIGGLISSVSALTHYASAKSHMEIASDMIESARYILDAVRKGKLSLQDSAVMSRLTNTLMLPFVHYAYADVYVTVAHEMTGLGGNAGPVVNPSSYQKLAKGYASAGAAVVGYIDALVVRRIADENEVSVEVAANWINKNEPNLPVARKAAGLAMNFDNVKGDAAKIGLQRLAFGAFTYLSSSALVNKHYSLGAEFNDNGGWTLTNRRSLSYQLDLAKNRALESAADCRQQVGFIPPVAAFDFQLASAFREGSDHEKLMALEFYWTASLWCQLAVNVDTAKGTDKIMAEGAKNAFTPAPKAEAAGFKW